MRSGQDVPLKSAEKNLDDRCLCSFDDLLYGPKRMLQQSLIRFDFRVNEQVPVQNRKFDRVYLAPFSSYAAHIRPFDGTFAPIDPRSLVPVAATVTEILRSKGFSLRGSNAPSGGMAAPN
jgi:hypothetical protein